VKYLKYVWTLSVITADSVIMQEVQEHIGDVSCIVLFNTKQTAHHHPG